MVLWERRAGQACVARLLTPCLQRGRRFTVNLKDSGAEVVQVRLDNSSAANRISAVRTRSQQAH